MKARKRMEHSNLIAEVTKQLSSRYHPDPQDIKRRIECLIEREYVERSADRFFFVFFWIVQTNFDFFSFSFFVIIFSFFQETL